MGRFPFSLRSPRPCHHTQDVLDASDPRISEKLASHLQRTFFRPVVLEGLAEVLAERRSQNDRIKAEALGGTVQEDREPEVSFFRIGTVERIDLSATFVPGSYF